MCVNYDRKLLAVSSSLLGTTIIIRECISVFFSNKAFRYVETLYQTGLLLVKQTLLASNMVCLLSANQQHDCLAQGFCMSKSLIARNSIAFKTFSLFNPTRFSVSTQIYEKRAIKIESHYISKNQESMFQYKHIYKDLLWNLIFRIK